LRVFIDIKYTQIWPGSEPNPRQFEELREETRTSLRLFPPTWSRVLLVLLLLGVAAPLSVYPQDLYAQEQPAQAQDKQNKPDSPQPKVQTDSGDPPAAAVNPGDEHANDEVPKRIFWIIPNFMTANDQPENKGPLTPKEKFNIAWHQFWDMSAHFGNVIQAGISQAANGLPHYGQGWGAFGERYLAQEGDQFSGSMLIYGVLPTVLHQDPRYFRRGRGKAWARIGYAASRVLIARTDSGKNTFNASQMFGQLGQASISAYTYYPKQDRKLDGVLQGWAINQGYNIGWNQLKEFTPDLGAYLRRHSKKKNKNNMADLFSDRRSPLSEAD
jgi:hypothetical protein